MIVNCQNMFISAIQLKRHAENHLVCQSIRYMTHKQQQTNSFLLSTISSCHKSILHILFQNNWPWDFSVFHLQWESPSSGTASRTKHWPYKYRTVYLKTPSCDKIQANNELSLWDQPILLQIKYQGNIIGYKHWWPFLFNPVQLNLHKTLTAY